MCVATCVRSYVFTHRIRNIPFLDRINMSAERTLIIVQKDYRRALKLLKEAAKLLIYNQNTYAEEQSQLSKQIEDFLKEIEY